MRDGARANRAFLGRAVRFLTEAGIRQFLDIGSGVPTQGKVHEVARAVAPESRVVYVDIDPVAIAHSRSVLDDFPRHVRPPVRLGGGGHTEAVHASDRVREHARAREISAFFDGLDLLEPGLVFLPQWRPDRPAPLIDEPERSLTYAGVARKNGP